MPKTKEKPKTIVQIAARAIELNQLIVQAQAELDDLKATLRADAESAPWRELPTRKGSVRAAFVPPYMGARKMRDGSLMTFDECWDDHMFKRSHFKLLFRREPVVFLDVKDPIEYARCFAKLTPYEQHTVDSLIEEKPTSIRITLPVKK